MRHEAKRVLAWLLAAFVLFTSTDFSYAYAEELIPDVTDVEQGSAANQHNHVVNAATDDLGNEASQSVPGGNEGTSAVVIGDSCYVRGDFNGDGSLNTRDALYLLGNIATPEDFPINDNRDRDMDEDGKVTNADAFYLLYASLWPDDAAYAGASEKVHSYPDEDPTWDWSDDNSSATAVFNCNCKEETNKQTITAEVTDEVVEEAGCEKAGLTSITAKVSFGGKTYTNVVAKSVTAKGHKLQPEKPGCTDDQTCTDCGYVVKAKGHSYEEVEREKEDCTVPSVITYKCEMCDATYTAQGDDATSHTLDFETKKVNLKTDTTCTYIETVKCSACHKVVETATYDKHSYVASITEEATCTEAGVKTYKCTNVGCEETYTEPIPIDLQAHEWNEGAKNEASGIITYTCLHDPAHTKTVVDATTSENNTVNVNKDVLNNTNEIAFADASLSLNDDVKNRLGENISIGAKVVTDEVKSKLTLEQQEQIQGEIYDFSLTSNGDTISDFGEKGEITISIDYTLGPDEDPDYIDVWYIPDDGSKPQVCKGTYSNGKVTFTVNHFSIFTIIKHTLATICDWKGHIEKAPETVDPTCVKDGYVLTVCQRCGTEIDRETKPATGHNWEKDTEKSFEPTCVKEGLDRYTCSDCNSTYEVKLPAKSHKWEKDAQSSTEATCLATGKNVYVCGNGCDETYEEDTPTAPHDYTDEVVQPTCTSIGYTVHKCSKEGCEASYMDGVQPALGHNYETSWSWDDNTHAATLSLVCKNDQSHTITVDATVSVSGSYANCVEDGKLTYSAKVVLNGTPYTDSKDVVTEAVGHSIDENKYEYDKEGHYATCVNCGDAVEKVPHVWKNENGEVKKEQNCNQDGLIVFECDTCGYVYEKVLEKSGEHKYDSFGNCEICHFRKDTCNHNVYHAEEIEVPGMPEGVALTVYRCDCGEYISDTEVLGKVPAKQSITYSSEADKTFVTTETIEYTGTGLVKTSVSKITNKVGTCISEKTVTDTYTLNGKVVTDAKGNLCTYTMSYAVEDHSPSKVTQSIGVNGTEETCKATYYVVACRCGKSSTLVDVIDGHNWTYDSYGWKYVDCGDVTGVDICAGCHIRRMVIDTDDEEQGTYSKSYVFSKLDGTEIARLDANGSYEESKHAYVFSYELLGETCQDGIMESIQCMDEDCGLRIVNRIQPKDGFFAEEPNTYDISEYCCKGSYTVHTCLCGKDALVEDDFPECKFRRVDVSDDEYKLICDTCGLSVISKVTETPEDVTHGQVELLNSMSYVDKRGNIVGRADVRFSYEKHSFDSSDKEKVEVFLYGDSCSDGYLVAEICSECGIKNYWTGDGSWHGSYLVKEEELSDKAGFPLTIEYYECYCGQSSWVDDTYYWDYERYDEELRSDVYWNEELGVYKTEQYDYYGENKDCKQDCKVTYSYYDIDMNEIISHTMDCRLNNHTFGEGTFELLGDSCTDGYIETVVCENCGYEEKWSFQSPESNWHPWYTVEVIDLVEQGIVGEACGGELVSYKCPCGAEAGMYKRNTNCVYDWLPYDEKTGIHTGVCKICGSFSMNKETDLTNKDEHCQLEVLSENTLMSADKSKKFEFTNTSHFTRHNFGYPESYELKGESCEDGLIYTVVCMDCNEKVTNETSYHSNFKKSSYNLADYGFCGGTVSEWNCLCGEQSYVNREVECNFVRTDNQYENGISTDTYECTICKGKVYSSLKELEEEGCERPAERTVQFISASQKGFTLNRETIVNHHIYCVIDDFVRQGERCEDGWSVEAVCCLCGKETSQSGTWHQVFCIERGSAADIRLCGNGLYTAYSCSCGKEKWTNLNFNGPDSCEWRYYYKATTTDAIRELWRYRPIVGTGTDANRPIGTNTDANRPIGTNTNAVSRSVASYSIRNTATNTAANSTPISTATDALKYITPELFESFDGGEITVYRCYVCGGYRYEIKGEEPIEVNGCKETYDVLTHFVGGTGVVSVPVRMVYDNHDYETTYSFPNGQDCELGIEYVNTCKKCGEVSSYMNYGHFTSLSEVESLSDTCNLSIITYQCKCGKKKQYRLVHSCDWPTYSYEGEWVVYSYPCGHAIKRKNTYEYDRENCLNKQYSYCDIYKGDLKVGGYVEDNSYPSHDYVYDGPIGEISPEECQSGVQYDVKCLVCGKKDKDYASWHQTVTTKKFYVGCGENGYIRESSCLCGKYTYADAYSTGCDWTYVSCENIENGYIQCERCSKCNATRTIKHIYGEKEGCREYFTEEHSYNYNNTVYTINRKDYYITHDYEYSYTFDGEVDCEQGVKVTRKCRRCGDIYTFTQIGHDSRLVETIEIPGSCSLKWVHYSCPCGKNSSYMMDGSNTCEWTDEQYKDGAYISSCTKCNTKQVRTYYEEHDVENCLETDYYKYEYYDEQDKLLTTIEYSREYTQHNMLLVGTVETDVTDCSEGVTVILECAGCKKQEIQEKTDGSHYSYPVNIVYPKERIGHRSNAYFSVDGCACGLTWLYDYTNCSWVEKTDEHEVTDNGELSKYICSECGATYQREITSRNQGCKVMRDNKYTFTYSELAEPIVITYTDSFYSHKFVAVGVPEVTEEACKDGIEITQKCRVCDKVVTNLVNNHTWLTKEYYDLTEKGCVHGENPYLEVRGCACGEAGYIDDESGCDWEYIDQNLTETGSYNIYKCRVCEATKEIVYSRKDRIGCRIPVEEKRTYSYKNADPIAVIRNSSEYEHDYQYSYTFDGEENCESGVRVTESCKYCDYSRVYYSTYHNAYPVETIEIPGSCSNSLRWYYYSCPCGKNSSYEMDGSNTCEWTDEQYKDGAYISSCTKCNTKQVRTYYEEHDVENCLETDYYKYEYYDEQDKLLTTIEYSREYTQHNMLLVGTVETDVTDCVEGVTVILECAGCKKQEIQEKTDGSHCSYPVNVVYPKERIGHRSNAYFCVYGCACGSTSLNDYTDCSWVEKTDEHEVTDNGELSKYVCSECGATYQREITSRNQGCKVMRDNKYTFTYSELAEPIVITYTSSYYSHEFVAVGVPEATEEVCKEGIEITQKCRVCDKVIANLVNDHTRLTKEYYDLTEKGCVHGENPYLEVIGCACGKEGYIDDESGCDWEYIDQNSTSDGYISNYKCRSCEATKEIVYSRKDKIGCRIPVEEKRTYSYKNADPIAVIRNFSDYEHDYQYSYTFDGEENCESGVTVTAKCKYCNYEYNNYKYYHGVVLTKKEIIPGTCGLEVEHYQCPCGQSKSFEYVSSCNWQYQGYENDVDTYKCSICEAQKRQESITEYDKENCVNKSYSRTVYTDKDGNIVASYETTPYIYERHNYLLVGTEEPLGTSCEEGITSLLECSVCGKEKTDYDTSHCTYAVKKLFLSDYLSDKTNNDYVEWLSCPCGTVVHLITNDGCSWSWEGTTSLENGNLDTYKCSDCNATMQQKTIYSEEVDGLIPYEYECTLMYPGEDPIVFTYSVNKPSYN